jgi:DNA-binding transcriptional ArsR family regulator
MGLSKVVVYRILGDETRYRILKLLQSGERTVSEIAAHCGRAQPTISLQLAKMEGLGLLDKRRDGKSMHYRIHHDRLGMMHRLL